MIIQVVIRLTVYLDQAIIRKKNIYGNETRHGIDNTVGLLLIFNLTFLIEID